MLGVSALDGRQRSLQCAKSMQDADARGHLELRHQAAAPVQGPPAEAPIADANARHAGGRCPLMGRRAGRRPETGPGLWLDPSAPPKRNEEATPTGVGYTPLTARLCKERGAPLGPPQILKPLDPPV
jgi:hypothetical protein